MNYRREGALFVGMDLHKEFHAAVMTDCWGELIATYTVENTPSKYPQIIDVTQLTKGQGIFPLALSLCRRPVCLSRLHHAVHYIHQPSHDKDHGLFGLAAFFLLPHIILIDDRVSGFFTFIVLGNLIEGKHIEGIMKSAFTESVSHLPLVVSRAFVGRGDPCHLCNAI